MSYTRFLIYHYWWLSILFHFAQRLRLFPYHRIIWFYWCQNLCIGYFLFLHNTSLNWILLELLNHHESRYYNYNFQYRIVLYRLSGCYDRLSMVVCWPNIYQDGYFWSGKHTQCRIELCNKVTTFLSKLWLKQTKKAGTIYILHRWYRPNTNRILLMLCCQNGSGMTFL